MNTIDVRNLSCPQPVIQTRKAMGQNIQLCILVSDRDQADNVIRMAENSGWSCTQNRRQDHYELFLSPGSELVETEAVTDDLKRQDINSQACDGAGTLVISSEYMGRGDDALGKILMKAFINTLKECSVKPEKIVFYNSGVMLTTTNSPVLKALEQLVSDGVEILVCGTCLDYYRLKDAIGVGIVSNMYDIAETMLASGVAYVA
jgi:selenium metabolism protein YedF